MRDFGRGLLGPARELRLIDHGEGEGETMVKWPENPFSQKPGDPFHVPSKLGEQVRLGLAAVAVPLLVIGLFVGPHTSEDIVIMLGFAGVAAVSLYDGLAMRRIRLAREREVAAMRENLYRDEG